MSSVIYDDILFVRARQARALVHSVACALVSACWALASLVPGFVELRPGRHSYTIARPDTKYLHTYTVTGKPISKAVIVFVHGGGWCAGALESRFPLVFGYDFIGRAQASRGLDTALISYPLMALPLHVEFGAYIGLAVFAVMLAVVLSCILLPLGFWLLLAVLCYVPSVLLLKQRTFAGSSTPFRARSVKDQIAIVDEMYNKLQNLFPGRPLVVVGHSAGAHIIAMLAARLLVFDTSSLRHSGGKTFSPEHVFLMSGPYDIAAMCNTKPGSSMSAVLWLVKDQLLKHVFSDCIAGTDGHNLRHVSPKLLFDQASRVLEGTLPTQWTVATALCDAPILEQQADEFAATLTSVYGAKAVQRVRGVGVGHGIGMVASEAVWAMVEQLVRQRYPASPC